MATAKFRKSRLTSTPACRPHPRLYHTLHVNFEKTFRNNNFNVNHHPWSEASSVASKRQKPCQRWPCLMVVSGGGGWECKTNESSIHETCKVNFSAMERQGKGSVSCRMCRTMARSQTTHFNRSSWRFEGKPAAHFVLLLLFGACWFHWWHLLQW